MDSREQKDSKMLHKHHMLRRKEKNNRTVTKRTDEIKVMYANIGGIKARKQELTNSKRKNYLYA